MCTLPARVHRWSNTSIIKLGNPCSNSCVKRIHLIHRGIVASLLRGTGAGNDCCDAGLVNDPAQRQLRNGDLVKLDVTVEKDGFMADAAVTVPVGPVSDADQKLMACAEHAFQKALLVARAGFRVFDIGRAVEKEVRRDGFSVIRELGGHGIGRTIHEKPRVPNFADTTATEFLSEGMVITIEPIIAAGKGEVQTQRDGWTVCTVDGSRSAHYEHTIVITRGRPIILTAA